MGADGYIMSRNSSGTYSLPVAAYAPLTAIVATDMNTNLNDIASTLTLSIPLDGTAPMSGSLKGADGSASAPSYAFNSSLGTGFYLNLTESGMAIVVASVSVVLFTSAGAVATAPYGAYWWYPNVFHGSVAFNGGLSFSTGINATTTITGNLTVTGGLIVGFSSAPLADRINIGDANFFWSNTTGLAPNINFDTNDNFRYTRADNEYSLQINSVTTYALTSTSMFYTSYLSIPEITAPSSAPSSNVYIYAKDNSGTTRVAYKDNAGVETFMGGPGGWEEITSFAVTASVASIVFSLSKVYSKIAVCGVSISATAGSTRQLIVEISDDAGGSYEAALAGFFGGPSGNIIGSVGAVSSPMRPTALTAAAEDLSFWVEFYMCNEAAQPKPFSGQAASFTDTVSFFGSGQTAVCDDVDAIRVRWDTGALIDAGTITLYGELAI